MKLSQKKLFKLSSAPTTFKTLACMNDIKHVNGPVKDLGPCPYFHKFIYMLAFLTLISE